MRRTAASRMSHAGSRACLREPAGPSPRPRVRTGMAIRASDTRLGRLDQILGGRQVLVDGALERRLATLDGRRGFDQPLAERVRDRSSARRIRVLRSDEQERAATWHVDLHLACQGACRLLEAEVSDHALEDRAGLCDRRVRCRKVLRNEELAVVRVRGRERLADDQRGSRLVNLLLEVADDVGRPAGQHGGHDHEREPGPSEDDQAAEFHGASLSRLEAGQLAGAKCQASIATTFGTVNWTAWSRGRLDRAPISVASGSLGQGTSVARIAGASGHRAAAVPGRTTAHTHMPHLSMMRTVLKRIWRSNNVVWRSRYSASSVSFAGRISSRYRRSASGPTRRSASS